jgi:hypothetical protein
MTKNLSSQDDRDSRTWQLRYLKWRQEENFINWKYNLWDEEEDHMFMTLLMMRFEILSDIWPFHLIKVNSQGLPHHYRKCFQRRGFQNFFPTSWLEAAHHQNPLGRCRKS